MATEFVTVGIKGDKTARIPRELWERGDLISMKGYIVESGQASWEDVGVENPVKPDIPGPIGSMLVGMGRGVDLLGSNIKQAGHETWGKAMAPGSAEALAERERQYQSEVNRLAQPLWEERPVSSFIGEAAPSMAVPGGRNTQIGAGAVEGYLQGDTPLTRLLYAGLGAAGGFLGQHFGDKMGAYIGRKAQSVLGNPKSAAINKLADAGIPLSPAQRSRDPLARLAEDVKGIIINSRNPMEGSQITRLNRLALRSIGEDGTEVTRDALGKAHTRLGNVFESAANNVNDIPFDTAAQRKISALANDVDVVETQGAAIRRYYDEILDAATGGAPITGKRYNQLRNRLGKASRAAWRSGDELAAETADAIMEIVDDAMANASPDIASALSDARRQWKMLRILRAAKKIDPEGNVNPNSMLGAFDSVYPGATVGKFPSGPEGEFGETLAAFNEAIRPRATSRTAENLIRVGVPATAAGAFLGGANPLTILGGLGLLGGLVSGGGAGGLLGGGATRGTIRAGIEQQNRQQENQ